MTRYIYNAGPNDRAVPIRVRGSDETVMLHLPVGEMTVHEDDEAIANLPSGLEGVAVFVRLDAALAHMRRVGFAEGQEAQKQHRRTEWGEQAEQIRKMVDAKPGEKTVDAVARALAQLKTEIADLRVDRVDLERLREQATTIISMVDEALRKAEP